MVLSTQVNISGPHTTPSVSIFPAWYVHFQESTENAEELLGKQLFGNAVHKSSPHRATHYTKLAKHRSGSNLRGGGVTARNVTIADLAGE